MSNPVHQGSPIVISVSDMPSLAPCCQRTAERHYRRGFWDGWKMASFSLGAVLPDWLVQAMQRFLWGPLFAWKRAGAGAPPIAKDHAPAFDLRLPKGVMPGSSVFGESGSRLRFAILKRDNYRCQLCGRAASDGLHIRLHVDHKVPKVKGGTHDPKNLWTLCQDCNRGKFTFDL